MTIIFDEKQAKENKMKVIERMEEEKEWKEMLLIMKKASCSMIVSFALVGVLFIHFEINKKTLIFATFIFLSVFLPAVVKILKEDIKDSVVVQANYSPDIEYMSAVKGKTVCDYNFVFHNENDTAEFYIITEDDFGTVEEERIGDYFEQVYTDEFKEITINLEESIMYIPKMSA